MPERLGRMDDAEASYREVLRLRPCGACTRVRLAVMRHHRASALLQQRLERESAGGLNEAGPAYREAATLYPARAIITRSLGRTLQGLGRFDESIAEYRKSLAMELDSAETHNDLGVVLAQCGRAREALEHFEAARSPRA